MTRAVASAARSAESTAHVFGIASASTKKKMTFRKKPTMTPVPPNNRAASSDVRNAWPVWQNVIVTRIGLMNRSG